jgi:exodeoxyribonuclease V gamma subunit
VKATRTAYEGGFNQKGEVETNSYLQRVYPDFNALSASGEFADLAETLLRPLQRAMTAKGKTTDKPVEQTESGAAS